MSTRLLSATGSKATRRIGALALGLSALALLFGLVISPPDVTQGESARLLYLHVPVAVASLYVAFTITLIGSVIYLKTQSVFWDLMAGAAAEVGLVFLGLTLITGMIWGKPTWGTYWTWEARLTSTAISFVLYLGYLAVRRLDMDPVARSQRAAVLGIITFFNIIIVRYSVKWWRGLHQQQTFDVRDTQLDGLMLFSFFLGLAAILSVFTWLVMHRFRLAWMEHQLDEVALEHAIAERTGATSSSGSVSPRTA